MSTETQQKDVIGPPLRLAIDTNGCVRLAYADGTLVPGVMAPMTTVTDSVRTRVTVELSFSSRNVRP